jgi:hypothetical protein
MARLLADTAASSEGAIRAGLLRAQSTVAGPDGEEMSVASLYNVSRVPMLLLWPPATGRRFVMPPLRLPAEISAPLLSSSKEQFRKAVDPLVSTLVVRAGGDALPEVFSDNVGVPWEAPRVFVMTYNSTVSTVLKRLSLDFAHRAAFIIVPSSDAPMMSAWGLDGAPKKPRMWVSRPNGLDAPPKKWRGKRKGPDGEELVWDPRPQPGDWANMTTYDPAAPLKLASLRAFLEANLPPPVVRRVRSLVEFEKECGTGVCFVGVLPSPLTNADAHKDALVSMHAAASAPSLISTDHSAARNAADVSAVRAAATFLWIDGEAQASWAGAFRVASPGLIAFNTRKKLFAPLSGSLSTAAARDFVDSVLFTRPFGLSAADASKMGWVRPPVDVRLEGYPSVPAFAVEVAEVEVAADGTKTNVKS